MPTDDEAIEMKLPSEAKAVVAELQDRDAVDRALEALMRAGFEPDQVSFVARGAGTVEGEFHPGVLMITVHAEGRDADATRILQEHGATKVTSGLVSATGDVVEESEAEREGTTTER